MYMNWDNVEPMGVQTCTECGKSRETVGEYEEDDPMCPECMYQQYGDEFLREWIIGAGVVARPEVHGEVVVFDYDYDLEIEFDLTHKEMPASPNPNETESIRYKQTDSDTAVIRFEGDKLGTVNARKWAEYADDFLYPS